MLIDDFLGFVFAFVTTSLTFLVSATELGLRIGMNTGALFAAVVNLGRLHEFAGFRPDFGSWTGWRSWFSAPSSAR